MFKPLPHINLRKLPLKWRSINSNYGTASIPSQFEETFSGDGSEFQLLNLAHYPLGAIISVFETTESKYLTRVYTTPKQNEYYVNFATGELKIGGFSIEETDNYQVIYQNKQGRILIDMAEGYGIPKDRSGVKTQGIANMDLIYSKCEYGNALQFDGINDNLYYIDNAFLFDPSDYFAYNIRFRVVDYPVLPPYEEFDPDNAPIGVIMAKFDFESNKGFALLTLSSYTEEEPHIPIYAIAVIVNPDGGDGLVYPLYFGFEKNLDWHQVIQVVLPFDPEHPENLTAFALFDNDPPALIGTFTHDGFGFSRIISFGAVHVELPSEFTFLYCNCEITEFGFSKKFINPNP